jgi:hypothetical protein
LECWFADDKIFSIYAYLVVNGGGNSDIDVVLCRALFYEHDDLPKELQASLWSELGLREPTFQVDTGGKSIHSYWVFDQPVAVWEWVTLQKDILAFSNADRKIRNPSRVMRLAGAVYFCKKSGQGIDRAEIISSSGKKYTYQELRAMIPQTTGIIESSMPLLP